MKILNTAERRVVFILLVCALSSFASCATDSSSKPTPDAAKRVLKLRGYEFNDASFLRAAAANDVTAVNGFLAAGMNPNVKDEDGGATALIFAATHDNREMVTALLRGGA